MIQKTGQDVGKAGTDSFPLEGTILTIGSMG